MLKIATYFFWGYNSRVPPCNWPLPANARFWSLIVTSSELRTWLEAVVAILTRSLIKTSSGGLSVSPDHHCAYRIGIALWELVSSLMSLYVITACFFYWLPACATHFPLGEKYRLTCSMDMLSVTSLLRVTWYDIALGPFWTCRPVNMTDAMSLPGCWYCHSLFDWQAPFPQGEL